MTAITITAGRREADQLPRRLFSVMLACMLPWFMGCEAAWPQLELRRAILTGESISVEVHTSILSSRWEGSPHEHDVRSYLLSFPLRRDSQDVNAAHICNVPWENELNSGYSSHYLVRVNGLGQNGPSGKWSAEIIECSRGIRQCQRILHWDLEASSFPPIVPSSDGHYLAVSNPEKQEIELMDTSTLGQLADNVLGPSIAAARQLNPGRRGAIWFTHNLSYLLVRISDGGATLAQVLEWMPHSSVLAAHAKTDDSTSFLIAINMKDGRLDEAIPFGVSAPQENHLIPVNLDAVDESTSGELLLLYEEYSGPSHGWRFTVRDKNLRILHELFLPPNSSEQTLDSDPYPSWDAARHRILFYHNTTLGFGRHTGPVQMQIWDYKAGTLQTIRLRVTEAFALTFGGYAPRGG